MNTKITVYSLLIVPLAIIAVLLQSVIAQQEENSDLISGSGFRVSPARYDVSVEAGETQTKIINVKNVTSTGLNVISLVDDFIVPDDESGNPILAIGDLETTDNRYSIKPFVTPLSKFSLAPGQEKDVSVTLAIPKDTAPGAYYGVVRFIQADLDNPDEGSIALTASVGTIMLITVPGTTVEKMNLVEIAAGNFDSEDNFHGGKFFSSSPETISIRLENEGNTFIAPFGTVNITDWSDNLILSYEINNATPKGNILPSTIRRFDNNLDDLGSFGRFNVTAHISYGDGGASIITARTSFWIVPWITLLIILIAIIILVFAGTRGIKAYNNMIIQKRKGINRKSQS